MWSAYLASEGKEGLATVWLVPALASEDVILLLALEWVRAVGQGRADARMRRSFSVHAFAFSFQEDHYALLVKAWETKVFPTIRRRFRNEAERKSGLDQIKGALQLGLVLYAVLGSYFMT